MLNRVGNNVHNKVPGINCANSIDDDSDTYTDCADPNCTEDIACPVAWYKFGEDSGGMT